MLNIMWLGILEYDLKQMNSFVDKDNGWLKEKGVKWVV